MGACRPLRRSSEVTNKKMVDRGWVKNDVATVDSHALNFALTVILNNLKELGLMISMRVQEAMIQS